MANKRETIDLNNGTVEEKREEIRNYFLKTYQLDETLFELLKDEKCFYEQPNKLRHPLIFYYGHTATFFINKLNASNISHKRINRYLESIFAIGVDEMSWDDLNNKNYQWPTYQETKKYRQEVKEFLLDIIENLQFSMPINWDSPMWIILMGIEHENIHIETTSVLLRELSLTKLKTKTNFLYNNERENTVYQNNLLLVKGAEVILEKDFNHPDNYGWDNEFAYHKATIKDFYASEYLVSNGEFMEFVNQEGYTNPRYFSSEGLKWLQFTQATCPTFWVKQEGSYFLREINRLVPLPLNYPVDLNFYEAEAFCKFKSEQLGFEVRLPSEDEYYRLYDYVDASKQDSNIGLKYFNQTPINKFCFQKDGKKFYDVVGNVWQWSLTPIYPFEGFKPHSAYDDFTTPTFDDNHALIKGGSFISLGNETLRSARYAFRKHFFQHAGLRYVKSQNPYQTKLNNNIYESHEQISQYCDFHYTQGNLGVKNFLQHSVELLKPYLKDMNKSKALDLGCSVGRTSFELANIFEEVVGIDFSANFIKVGIDLQTHDSLTYKITSQGELHTQHTISLKTLGLEKSKNKVTFMQGDACNLKEIYQGYDLVFCSNLIDRLYNPQKFLEDIPSRVNQNGLLVLLSPYTWLEEHTPKENWLGGYIKDGKEVDTLETIKKILSSSFELVDTFDIPFVIKETKRKYQYSISEASIWRKI